MPDPGVKSGGCIWWVVKYTPGVATTTPEPKPELPRDGEPKWLAVVQRSVQSMKYGEVRVVVHNGQVTQIERTEKLRLDAGGDYEI
jgi:hypothetical protein